MRRYLVVAHRTLGGAHLMEHLHELRVQDPYCRFHLVVPRYHGTRLVWSDGEVDDAALERLDEILDTLAAMGMGATGEIGDANPVVAVEAAVRHVGIDDLAGIVISTLPRSRSIWMRNDVPRRVAKRFPTIPVEHLVAEDALVS